MTNLQKRLIAAAIGIPIALSIILLGGLYFLIALIVVSSLALQEFYLMIEKMGYKPLKIIGHIFSILLLIVVYNKDLIKQADYFDLLIIIFLLSTVLFLLIVVISNYNFVDMALTAGGVFYISYFLSFLLIIEFLLEGPLFILAIITSIWVCDSAAFFFGKQFGKHRFAPTISPNKTWEGAIAGLIFAGLSFMFFAYFFIDSISIQNGLVLGLIIGTFGQAGDLFESKLKRHANVKDSSNLLPGHGGLLDRFDSLIFSAPLVYTCLHFIL